MLPEELPGLCDVCGNEVEDGITTCPFCQSKLPKKPPRETRIFSQKTVNIEQGRPVVEMALKRLHAALLDGRTVKLTMLTLIHGYGSSGKGGAIRTECRKTLDYLCSKGEIAMYIPGEQYSSRNGLVKGLLQRYPEMKNDKNLNKNNQGITVVLF